MVCDDVTDDMVLDYVHSVVLMPIKYISIMNRECIITDITYASICHHQLTHWALGDVVVILEVYY